MDTCGNEILRILGNEKDRIGQAQARRGLSEYVLINGPYSRLALGLLEKTVSLKKANPDRPCPIAGLEAVKEDFMTRSAALHGQLTELLAHLQA